MDRLANLQAAQKTYRAEADVTTDPMQKAALETVRLVSKINER